MLNISPPYITQTYNQFDPSGSHDSKDILDNGTPAVLDSSGKEVISVSARGRSLSQQSSDRTTAEPRAESSDQSSHQSDTAPERFSYNDLATLKRLQARDKEVRAHEQAHLAAAGQYAVSGASFQYQRGPDGQTYAVGGEVSISTGPENSPSATITKMEAVRRAALAPASPSSADRQIAAQAAATLAQARQELQQQQQTESSGALPAQTGNEESMSSLAQQEPPDPESMVQANIRTLMVETYSAINELI